MKFYVNGELLETNKKSMSGKGILELAEFVPVNKFFLHDQCIDKNYKDYSEEIELYEGKALLALGSGPTPTA